MIFLWHTWNNHGNSYPYIVYHSLYKRRSKSIEQLITYICYFKFYKKTCTKFPKKKRTPNCPFIHPYIHWYALHHPYFRWGFSPKYTNQLLEYPQHPPGQIWSDPPRSHLVSSLLDLLSLGLFDPPSRPRGLGGLKAISTGDWYKMNMIEYV